MGAGQRSMDLGEAHQAGTHSVSLRPSDTSCSPLTGHPLQTWRALSPRGASWARCTLGCEGRKGVCSGQHHPWDPSAQPRPLLSLPPMPRPSSVSFSTPPSSPSSSSSAGLLGQPRRPLPAGSASLTLGPSVPGVPGRPRAPWRPWAPGEPRSPGKPRSPCGRDTKERLGQRDEVEARGEAGR